MLGAEGGYHTQVSTFHQRIEGLPTVTGYRGEMAEQRDAPPGKRPSALGAFKKNVNTEPQFTLSLLTRLYAE